MNRTIVIIALLVLSGIAGGQSFTDSNLPVVIINTDGGVNIVDNPRVRASMKILYRGVGQRNYLADQNNPFYLNYNGRIDIEIRGSSSQVSNKKNYGFTTRMADNTTNNNVGLLDMPKENDWVLNGMVFDPALIRDFLCYTLSRKIGEYASRTVYCELIINGEYKGLYLLQEKIKADDNRVDVTKINTNDNSLPDVTGGYITKADKTTGGDPVAWTMFSYFGASVSYIHELPKPETVTASQNQYIHNQFIKLEAAAFSQEVSVTSGYPSVIDVPSFIDYIIINELASNADAYQFSTFFHKDRNGKLRAGPIWDNDLTYGNDLFFWGYDRSKTNIWQFSDRENEGTRYWRDLFSNPEFKCYLAKRWNELIQPGQPLNPEAIGELIDQTVVIIAEAVARDNALWGKTGNHQQRIEAIKTFLANRIPWMSDNLGSYASCSNVDLPPLVITKIMYHPSASVEFPDEDDLEYLEITNNGDEIVSLDGIYFAGTGLVFQFPSNSFMDPYSTIIIAGDYKVFRAKYGFTPFGQFTRNLSNNGENLVLADGFGNIIDNVCYYDTIPWPDADGNGSYLKLINTGLDNNYPSSWVASDDLITSTESPIIEVNLRIYPNPVKDILKTEAGFEIKTLIISDLYGKSIINVRPNTPYYELDVRKLPKGIYILRIEADAKTFIRKFVKD